MANIHITLSADQLAKTKKLAESEYCTVASIVRKAVARYLQEKAREKR